MTSLNLTPMPVGVDVQVNTTTDSIQLRPVVTALLDGGFVVTWDSDDLDRNSWEIYARRYDHNGVALGEDFRVNTSTTGNQELASVAALSDGGFVVAWTSGDAQVYGQRFGSDGAAVGGEFRINSSVTGDHSFVAVSGFSDGGFLAAWEADGQDGSLYGIYGQRYDADGAAMGGEFRINSYTANNQVQPALATMADGGFVVTWSSVGQDGSSFGVYGQRFASDGAPVGPEFRVNTYTVGQQTLASPTALLDGGFVVTWTSQSQDGSVSGIYGQRYGAADGGWVRYGADGAAIGYGADGVAIGVEFRINTYTNDSQVSSFVTALSDGGFVVTWSSNNQDGSRFGIYGQRFTADAKPAGDEFRVNETTAGDQVAETMTGSPIATLASGRLVQVWSGIGGIDQVFFRLIDVLAPAFTSGTTGSIAENAPTSVVAYNADVTADGPITYSLSGDDSNLFAIDRDDGQVRFLASPNFEGPADKYADNVYDIVVHARNGSSEISRAAAITVTDQSPAASLTPMPLAGDVQVNSYTAGTQAEAAVTSLSDGGFVVTWTSWDGSDTGISGQRYAEDGTAIGSEFKVNTYTTSDQAHGSVTSLSDGGFVVTWSSRGQDGDGYGIFGQRYTGAGVAAGSEFRVNTSTKGDQTDSSVAPLPDGGFVVTWLSAAQDGSSAIYGQRYVHDGSPVGSEFKINTYTAGTPREPAATSLSDGGFLVTWTSIGQDGSAGGVYGQRYGSDGTAQGGEFKVNSYTTNDQSNSSATSLSDGGFVVTWSSFDQDHSGYGIYGQRYTQKGLPVGADFKVNTETAGNQLYSSVTSLPDGGFVVTWTSSGQDGSGRGVYGQCYAADGTSVGGEFRLNETTAGNQGNATGGEHVTSLHDGHFVQVWSGTEVFFRRAEIPWGDDNTPPWITSDGGQETASLSVAENTKAVTTVAAYDVDAGQTMTYSLAGGADAAAFAIDAASGVLSFVAAPDFEAPADANKDNVYEVVVKVSDGAGGSDSQALGVTVTNVNTAPTITSGGGQGTASLSVAENTKAVTTVVGHDTDTGQTLTYSLGGGADAAAFAIDGTSGVLSFVAAPDFEAPADANKDNVYDVVVAVSDGAGGTASQVIGVTVTNANTAPAITSGAAGTVAENAPATTVVYDAAAKDDGEDHGTLTYSLAADGDSKLFDIDAGTGQVTFKAPADFDKPGDAAGNNVYEITVQASDGSLKGSQAVSVTVTDQNDMAPVITTAAALSVAENTLVVAALTSSDVDTVGTNPARFTVSGGADAALFEVADGNLAFKTARDYETDRHSYQVEVTASDGVNQSARLLTVTLTDRLDDNNAAPTITSGGGQGTASLSVAENTKAVTTVVGHDTDTGQTLTYSLGGGADAAAFAIDGTSGALSFVAAPDFEAPADANKDNVYDVVVAVSDGAGGSASQAIGVTVTDTAGMVAENAPVATVVYDAAANDAGKNIGTLTYSLAAGGDSKLFDIDADTGRVTFKSSPDFEAPADANKDNVYEITVQASHGSLVSSDAVSITVTDQNDNTPIITTAAALSVPEHMKEIVTLTSTDPDTVGGAFYYPYYLITGGADAALFEILNHSLEFIVGRDYTWQPHSYQVEVTASDGVNESAAKLLTIALTDQNDQAPEITTGQDLSVAENTLVVAALTSTDVDTVGTNPAEFSVSGGTDAALFDVADGNLVFKKAPDFDTDPERYVVEVTASDGVNKSTKVLAVWLNDQNDTAPVITTAADPSVAENTLVVAALTSNDVDTVGTKPAKFSISGGADAALFDVADGNLVFKKSPDFETDPHSYQVEVTSSDGVNHSAKLLTVTLTDQNDNAPVITTGADLSVAENTLVVSALTSTDVDTVGTNPAEFSISGGADAGLFDVAGGSLVFKKAPDFETDPHSYQVEVTASDGVNHSAKLLTVTLTDLLADNNTAPSITSDGGQGTASVSVAENTKVVTTVVGHDTDAGQTLTYSLAGGADAAAFAIDGASGVLSFVGAPDFEVPADANKDNVYEVVVEVSDGAGGTDSQAIGVTVTDVNAAPTITSGAAGTVAENAPVATVVYDAEAKDDGENGRALTYSLADGGDSKLFDIDAGTGEVTFKASADFETPGGAGGNNVYEITIQASDGSVVGSHAVSITVTDQNDVAPVITTAADLSVAENTLVVAALTSTDSDTVGTQPAMFSVTGGADAALFGVVGGNLVFKTAADFETDRHSYQVEVTASDGVNHSTKLLTVTLTNFSGDDNTAPSITSNSGQGTALLSVSENTKGATTVVAHDTDVGQTLTYSLAGGADASSFAIGGASGVLSFAAAPDFEAPTDANKDNVYDVVVEVSDGAGGTDSQAVSITVTDQNDVAPVVTTDATLSVAENSLVVAALASTDVDTVGIAPAQFSVSGGADAALFDVADGNLVFKKAADFEVDPHSYQVEVTASDGVNKSTKLLTVTLTNFSGDDNAPPSITSDGGQGTASLSVAENTKAVATVVAHDTDDGQTLTYSLAGGADAAAFVIDGASGALSFVAAPDFEAPADANKDNVYEVVVEVSDGAGGTDSQAIGVTVTDVNTAPTITSGAAGTVAENAPVATVVYDAEAKDDGEKGGTLTYSLADGGDSKLFNIDAGTGQITFKSSPDFEVPGDADANNVYEIAVQASRESLVGSQAVSITVTDQNDNMPLITTAAALSVVENTLVVAALTLTDADTVGTRPAEFSVSGGADAALFDVAGGNLVFKTARDFETDPHSYQVEVTASDGVNHSTELLTITLTDLSGVTITGTAGRDIVDATTTVAGQPLPTSEDDVIYGLGGVDNLSGLAGNDRLDGGIGIDAMRGGPGNDTYVVDYAGDYVAELENEGNDTVEASATYTLTANVERLILTGSEAIDGTGNSLANRITGNEMANRLDGGAGQDTLTGLGGNDTYVVDDQEDTIIEAADGGVDLVISSAFLFTLPAEVENLTLAFDAGDAFGVGNGLANTLVGNAGVNTLIGNAGADTLDGGAGADYLLGGAGNDLYRVDDTFDLVDEGGAFPAYAGSATDFDTISSTAEWFWDVYSVGERLQIEEGAVGSDGGGTTIVGSVFSNEMIGNSGNNIMFGRGGADTYRAGDGVDWISLSLLGVTEQNAYVGVDGVNTIIVDQRQTGAFSYDIIVEFEAGKDKIDVSSYGYATATEVLQHGHDDGRGNSYYELGDGFDYVYLIGVTTSQVHSTDFVV